MAFLTKALSVHMLTINRYGRKQKMNIFGWFQGWKVFWWEWLLLLTYKSDVHYGLPLNIMLICFFFFTWKMNKCHCLFLNSARHSLPFRRFPLQRQPNNDSSTQFGQQSLSFEHLSEVDVLHSQIHLTYVILVT